MPKVGENWKCPYCGHAQVVADSRIRQGWTRHYLEGWKEGQPVQWYELIACANSDCQKLSMEVAVATFEDTGNGRFKITSKPETWTLLPASSAKPQPDYIPKPLRDDYYEACAIRDLSPKASATLARRCLQGMIRDFCKIQGGQLFDEIKKLRDRFDEGDAPRGVTHESIEAIDHVRSIGNIGAHMEKDVNLIVEIDPGEAQSLIELIEMLFEEWYVERRAREVRLAQIAKIGEQKKQERKGEKQIAPSDATQ